MKSLLLSAALAIGLVGAAFSLQPATAVAATPTVVKITNFAYGPASVTIDAGQTVEWINEDSAQHTATAIDGTFKSPTLDQGHHFSHTFTKAGTYAYYCTFHRGMKGTVVVK